MIRIGATDPEVSLLPVQSDRPAIPVWLASLVTFILAAGYNFWVGLIVFMGDSYLLADRAKHLIYEGTLGLDRTLGTLVYPPLYPILISPAYLFGSPLTSLKAILLIHAILVSLQVWPLYRLLTEYAMVPARPAMWLAIALSLAPFTLPYAAMMLTEVSYFPVLLWMTYFFVRYKIHGRLGDAARAGVFVGLMFLVRTAASTVLVGFVGAALFSISQNRSDTKSIRQQSAGLAVTLAAFAVVVGIWKCYEKLSIVYGPTSGYFTLEEIRIIFAERARFDHHFNWLTNTIFYYLTAPLCVAGCYFYSLIFRRLKTLLRDPLFPFAILTLLVSALTVVLVMTKGWGGRDLTWNKYLEPYVFLIVLVALRYRALFNRVHLLDAGLILSLIFLAFRPSTLGCHFTDALSLFTANSNPLAIPETLQNAVYVMVVLVPAWLWIRGTGQSRTLAVGLTACMWVASIFGAAFVYRNSGDLNMSNYAGAAKRALEVMEREPNTKIYYDPSFTGKDMFGSMRILLYLPKILTPIPFEQLGKMAAETNVPFLYFTDKEVPGATPLAEDRAAVRLYSIAHAALESPGKTTLLAGSAPTGPKLKATFGPDVWGEESSVWNGQSVPVRWFRQSTSFQIVNPGPGGSAVVAMKLDVLSSRHSVQLEANGELIGDKAVVSKVLWVDGPQEVSFRVPLKAGRNTFKLLSPEKPDLLPGGREVCLLGVGNIEAALQ